MHILTHIVSQLLNISLQQADAILDLIQLEQLISQDNLWEETKKEPDGQLQVIRHTKNLQDVQTQYDLFELLEIIGQAKLFSGLDRQIGRVGKEAAIAAQNEKLPQYFAIMNQLDLCSVQGPEAIDFTDSLCIIQASDLKTVEKRVEKLKTYLLSTETRPLSIFGFGSNRLLTTGCSSDEKTAYEQQFLTKNELESCRERAHGFSGRQ